MIDNNESQRSKHNNNNNTTFERFARLRKRLYIIVRVKRTRAVEYHRGWPTVRAVVANFRRNLLVLGLSRHDSNGRHRCKIHDRYRSGPCSVFSLYAHVPRWNRVDLISMVFTRPEKFIRLVRSSWHEKILSDLWKKLKFSNRRQNDENALSIQLCLFYRIRQ